MSKIVCVVQCMGEDLGSSRDEYDYSIGVCKESGLFDKIVLACPDINSSSLLEECASDWSVEIFKGSEFNVAKRIYDAAKQYSPDFVVRVLLRQFYLDVTLLKDMITFLKSEKADYVAMAKDFNYALVGDVSTFSAIEKAVKLLDGDSIEIKGMQFNPWHFMEQNKKEFKTIIHNGCENYEPGRVKEIKEKYGRIASENQTHFSWKYLGSPYAFASQVIRKEDSVLDIACARGEGCRHLIEKCKQVTGVDYDSKTIEIANERYANISGITFLCQDAQRYSAPEKYDVIISLHTLEHLKEPIRFLTNCFNNLKENGRLVIEVPLLLPRPLGEPLLLCHDKEYTPEMLDKELLEAGFRIDKKYGISRHSYVELDQARQGIQYHCSK